MAQKPTTKKAVRKTDPREPVHEIKASLATPSARETREAFNSFMSAFDAFKDANDERLAQIENKLTYDPLSEQKVDHINTALSEQKQRLDDLMLKSRRPSLGDDAIVLPHSTLEHKRAWRNYIRKGEDHNLRDLEAKALSVAVNADGGYLVPDETEQQIGRLLADMSPIRAIASIRQISGTTYKKPFITTGPATGWVGEIDARPETTSPVLSEIEFPAMELYAMPAATSTILDDAAVNIEQWLAEEVQATFAEQESTAFVTGDGVKKPRGFLDYPTVTNATWSWGNLGYIATGVAGGFAVTDPSDDLIDLVYATRAGYRMNAHWVMNRRTQAEIRKMKDADGNYLWRPGTKAGEPASLFNYPISESEDMSDIATDSYAIAFGNFQKGYLIVDRVGIRILRDPYSSKPYVLFYITKRVGGGVQDFDALKLLKFGLT